eukprot:TRINITY_DN12004_c1_g3_i1.p1 TRINITY_DN12004_c1_g3~~TRINITY_DN12004_c1_g3_i1.p1  ORF type:complete len:566 (+),score=68.34 TRINITY_DN12004_c1_g3_i1:101-1798(+)
MASSRRVLALSLLLFAVETVSDLTQLLFFLRNQLWSPFLVRLAINILPGVLQLHYLYLPQQQRAQPSLARKAIVGCRLSWLQDGLRAFAKPNYVTMHPFCLRPSVLAFDAATKGVAQLLFSLRHINSDEPLWSDAVSLATSIVSIAWAVSSFDAGAFKHRQVWRPAAHNRATMCALVVLRCVELMTFLISVTIMTKALGVLAAIATYVCISATGMLLSARELSSLTDYIGWLPVAMLLYLDLRTPLTTVFDPKQYFRYKFLATAAAALTAWLSLQSYWMQLCFVLAGLWMLILLLAPFAIAHVWQHKAPPARRAVKTLADCSPRVAVSSPARRHSQQVMQELTTSGMFMRRQITTGGEQSDHDAQDATNEGSFSMASVNMTPIQRQTAIVTDGVDSPLIGSKSVVSPFGATLSERAVDSQTNLLAQQTDGVSDMTFNSPPALTTRATHDTYKTAGPAATNSAPVTPRMRAWMQAQPSSLRLLAAAGRALKPTLHHSPMSSLSSISPVSSPLSASELPAPKPRLLPEAEIYVQTWQTSTPRRDVARPAIGLQSSVFGRRQTTPVLS